MSYEPATASSADRILMVLCHLATIIGGIGIILPLIIYIATNRDNKAVASHAKAAFNFQLSLLVYGIVSALLIFIGIGVILVMLVWLFGIVMAVIATIKAINDEPFSYPMTIQFIK